MALTAQTAAAQSVTPRICWLIDRVEIDPSLKAIVKGDGAYRPLPKRTHASTPQTAAYGAIRRVELPPGSPKKVALTFDLCEQPYEISGYDSEIVQVLRRHRVRATFFAGGKWLITHKALAHQLMADSLVQFGNHTWEHRNLRLLQEPSLSEEIDGAQIAYERLWEELAQKQCLTHDGRMLAHEHAPKHLGLFRFPFGACNPTSLEAVARLGLQPIQWDVSSGDSTPGLSAEQMASAVISNVRSGSIVLFHANGRGWKTAQALPIIISALRKQGFEFVTVGALLSVPGAKPDIRPMCFDSKPGDTDRYDAFARGLHKAYRQFSERFRGTPGAERVIIPPTPIPATRLPIQ